MKVKKIKCQLSATIVLTVLISYLAGMEIRRTTHDFFPVFSYFLGYDY